MYGMHKYVIIFGSFLHGVGRTYTLTHLANFLKNRGYSIIKLSIGEIFRDIALREYNMSIDDFSKYLLEKKELSFDIDIKTDSLMKTKILKYFNEGDFNFILVDGNIAPYYVDLENSIKILIDADINIVANRVYKYSRKGDKKYRSPIHAKLELLKRTQHDILRYKLLANYILNRNYKSYMWLAKAYDMFYNRITKPFDIRIKNNKGIDNTIRKLVHYLDRRGII